MYCSSGLVYFGFSGTITAPSLAAANIETTNSGQLGRFRAMRSPASMPSSWSAAASAVAWAFTWA
jgi:acid phosphatase family membrane protein YuiD